MSKLITIFGATGKQGGSVIKAILADATLSKEFKIRGITRDVSKPAAQTLAAQGIEMKAADMSNKTSLIEAVLGSHTVFLVTTPNWGAGAPDAELTEGKNVADAAKEAGVEHLIFSSLLHVTESTGGRLKHVPHFDQKAEVERYIRASGLPCTFILPGYFMTNFLPSSGLLRKGEDGVYILAYPVGHGAKFPLIDIEEDMGKYVVASMHKRYDVLSTQILAAADYYTPTRILLEFEQVTGKKARFVPIDPDTFKNALPEPLADEMLENHLFIEEPGYYAGKDLKDSLDVLAKVGLEPTSWIKFLQMHKNVFQ